MKLWGIVDGELKELHAEIARLRLTVSERQTLKAVIRALRTTDYDVEYVALQKMLERLAGTGDTPPPHTTPPQGSVPGEGSVPRSGTENEPVAWVAWFDDEDRPDPDFLFSTKERADEWCCKRGADPVPLYRHPQEAAWQLVHETERLRDEIVRLRLTEEERSLLAMLADHPRTHEIMPHEVATLRGLLERMGGER